MFAEHWGMPQVAGLHACTVCVLFPLQPGNKGKAPLFDIVSKSRYGHHILRGALFLTWF